MIVWHLSFGTRRFAELRELLPGVSEKVLIDQLRPFANRVAGWQKHTVRGFMAGAMKKAGHTVESFKSEKGERTYRINQ